MKKQKMEESETVELKKSLAELRQGLVSIKEKTGKEAATTKEKSMIPKETPKKLSSLP